MDMRMSGQPSPRQQSTVTPDTSPVASTPATPPPLTAPSHRPKWLLAALAVLAVFALGGSAYVLTSRRQGGTPAANTTAQSTHDQAAVTPTPSASSDSALKQYTSNGNNLDLSFSYPGSWSATPPTNSNPNDHEIDITSPIVSLDTAAGASASGKIVVSIRAGGSVVTELASDKATAAQASVQIAYDKPTSAQHQYPYLTFIHLTGGSNPAGAFEEVMITGVVPFAKDQAILQASAGQFAPIISARFYTCSDTTCNTATAAPLSITDSIWNADSACTQALAIMQSLQIN